jgi:hypothetical protein
MTMDVVMNAPGMCTQYGTTFEMLVQQLKEVLIGPITLRKRMGLIDSPNRHTCADGSYIDAGYMPNPGMIQLASQLSEICQTARRYGTRVRLAVASTGEEKDELPALVEWVAEAQLPDIIEIWLSRPYYTANERYIPNLSTAPRVIGGVLDTAYHILEEADAHIETTVEVRLAPVCIDASGTAVQLREDTFLDPYDHLSADRIDEYRLREALRPIENHKWINGLVITDDLPAQATDAAGRPVLYTSSGHGMLGGRIRSQLMRQQAQLVHTQLPERRIVGHGGIDLVAPQRSELAAAGISAIQLEPGTLLA